MYRVLIADDEEIDLEGIRDFIPWDCLGMKVAACVYSGFEALQVMEKEKIDILVTDIRMPKMSGLELARKALILYPNLRIVLMSGYEDFHYAKQAIAMKVCNYLTKPIDDDELTKTLREIARNIDMEREQHQIEKVYRQVTPMIKDQYLQQWLKGLANHEVKQALIEEYGVTLISQGALIAIIEIDDVSWKLNQVEPEAKENLLSQVLEHVADCLSLHEAQHYCRINPHRLAVILDLGDKAQVMDILTECMVSVKKHFPLSVTIGLGSKAAQLEYLPYSYRKALEALELKWLEGKDNIIDSSQIQNQVFQSARKLDIKLDSLFAAMSKYELERISDELEEWFELLMQSNSRMAVHHFAVSVNIKLDEYLRTMGENLYDLLGIESKNMGLLFQFETIADVKQWMRLRLFEISELLQMKRQGKNRRLINEVISYIEMHSQQHITLKEVGEHFSFSPNHIGYLFKEETGQSFTDFVIQHRLNKARDLLKDPKLRVYEIADLVGYRDLTFFSRQFKERFGISPGEYRKHC